MTPIALILNLLLGGLLIAALAMGLRLDRRLRALRDSQASFIKAVAELDQAAARTRAGLDQWRGAADEARELLHDRTEKAKAQAARLETLLAEAARAPEPRPEVARPAAAPAESSRFEAARAEPGRRILEAPALIREALREAALEAAPEHILTLTPRDAVRAPPEPKPARAEPARSRSLIDDDLFDAPPTGAVQLQRDLASALDRRP